MRTLNTKRVKVVKVARVNRTRADNRAMTTMTSATVDSNNKEGMAASNKADMVNNKVDTVNNKVDTINNKVDTINNKVDMEDNKEVNKEVMEDNKAETMIRINRMGANNNRVDMAAKMKAEPNTPIRATIKAPDMVRQPTKWGLIVGGHGGRAQGGAPPPQGGSQGDYSGAAQVAQQHAGSAGEQGMFSQAIQHMQSGNHQGPINEQAALQAHQQVYQGGGGGAGGLAAGSIGTAAALQALKGMVSGGVFPIHGACVDG